MAEQRFEDLVVRYQHAVCAVAYSVLRNRARSEEIAQEAFLVAWQKLPAMSPMPAMPGWICGIAKNLASNAARRKQELPMSPNSEDANEHPTAPGSQLTSLIQHEEETMAERALAELPDTYRDVVVMYYRNDCSLGEVATALGITEANAKQRLHRGREQLRTAFAAVEKTLRATRPSPAFVAGCVAALGAAGLAATATTAEAATMTGAAVAAKSSASVSAAVWAIPAVLAVAGVGGWLLVRDGDTVAPANAADATVQATAATKPPPAPVATTGSATPKRKDVAIRRLTPAARQELAQRIDKARTTREGTPSRTEIKNGIIVSGGASEPQELQTQETLSRDEIRSAVKAVVPLLSECFENALPHLAVKHGKVVSHLVFTGEPGVGTVVESKGLDGEPGFVSNSELTECWTQTLLSLELPPLEAGGSVEVTYPFEFAAGDDGG